MEQGFSEDAVSGGRNGYFSGGIGWYKKEFSIPETYKNYNIQIEFEGVYKDTDVWVNEQLVGHQKHGYLSFYYDITPYLKTEGINTITLKVNNADLPHDRWYSGAGIYRNVKINYLPKLYFPIWETRHYYPRGDPKTGYRKNSY